MESKSLQLGSKTITFAIEYPITVKQLKYSNKTL